MDERRKHIETLGQEVLELGIDINNYTPVAVQQLKTLQASLAQKQSAKADLQQEIISTRILLNTVDAVLTQIQEVVAKDASFIEKSSSSPNPIRPYRVFMSKTRLDEEIFAQNKDLAQTNQIQTGDLDTKTLAKPENLDLLQIAIHQGHISIDDGFSIMFGGPSLWEYEEFYSDGVVVGNPLPKNTRVLTFDFKNTTEIIPSTDAIEAINKFGLSISRGIDTSIIHLFKTTEHLSAIEPIVLTAQEQVVRQVSADRWLLLRKSTTSECNICVSANAEINKTMQNEIAPYVPEIVIPRMSDETVRNKDKIGVLLHKAEEKPRTPFIDILGEVFLEGATACDLDKVTSIFAYEKKIFGRDPSLKSIKNKIRNNPRELNSIY
ncbi:hypothetical protein KDA11_06330, partial [Candidatus Saccharibacteria bacterium]|nr:hypothetical protein [Candidatus Saccharibacteria bacterium]